MECHNLSIAPELRKLFGYLVDRGGINALDNYDPQCLNIFSREVLRKIQQGDDSWEDMVPAKVAGVIKEKNCFDYQSA